MPKYMTTTCSVCIMSPIFMISEEFAVTFCLPGLQYLTREDSPD